jgi:hypothetical protein
LRSSGASRAAGDIYDAGVQVDGILRLRSDFAREHYPGLCAGGPAREGCAHQVDDGASPGENLADLETDKDAFIAIVEQARGRNAAGREGGRRNSGSASATES